MDLIEQLFGPTTTPEERARIEAAVEAAEQRQARLVKRPCSQGRCVEFVDPDTGEVDGGWGPVGCPCQNPTSHKEA